MANESSHPHAHAHENNIVAKLDEDVIVKKLSEPGFGWTNGSMYPLSTKGRVALYSSQRRWINSKSSWTRIGAGSALDATHSKSGSGVSTLDDPREEARHVRSLIAQLCEKFYSFGWASGTAGGVSIRVRSPGKNHGHGYRVFVTPSGIQKEDMVGDDVFELDMRGKVVCPPKTPNLKLSACTPLWFVVFKTRPSAMCIIHTHSMNAQMATLLDTTETAKSLTLTHLEMLKGVGNHAYDDILEIPIIDNRPTEDLLSDQLEEAINNYPKCNAVLVRRHGLFVWGDSWEQAKTQCESFDYLFETAVKMKSLGIEVGLKPNHNISLNHNLKREYFPPPQKNTERSSKRAKLNNNTPKMIKQQADDTDTFNGVADANNDADLSLGNRGMLPLVPKDCKILLLDIEGCTTSISFVKDVLFPYVLNNIDTYLNSITEVDITAHLVTLEKDVNMMQDDVVRKQCAAVPVPSDKSAAGFSALKAVVKGLVEIMVRCDVKATGLKNLQGKMWKAGYASGELKGHVYPDFPVLLQWCRDNGVEVNMYSSGSVGAQQLLFSNSTVGDLTPLLKSHFDTTSGGKKEAASYQNIAKELGVDVSRICFVSDAEAELVAARQAGIGFVVMSVRPGNAVMTDVGYEFPQIFSMMQLCGC